MYRASGYGVDRRVDGRLCYVGASSCRHVYLVPKPLCSRCLSRFSSLLLMTAALLSVAQAPVQASPTSVPQQVTQVSAAGDTRLQTLTELLTVEDPLLQWGLAVIALEVLIEAYAVELEQSLGSTRSSPQRRSRLIGWQKAVDGYIVMLQDARRRLDNGAPLELFVDPRRRVVMAIGDSVVLVEAPGGSTVAGVEHEIVDRFCDYNDCDWLGLDNSTAGDPVGGGRGEWSFEQGGSVRYRLDQSYEFEFHSLADRDAKAAVAEQAADEIARLGSALIEADLQGYPVDWAVVSGRRPSAGSGNLSIDQQGGYLDVRLRLLPRLRADDWQQMIRWIETTVGGWRPPSPLIIRHADRLLQD